MFASRFLHFVQILLLIFQLSLHLLYLLLLLGLVLVPFHTVDYAVCRSKLDRCVENANLTLQLSNLILLRQNLRLQVFG